MGNIYDLDEHFKDNTNIYLSSNEDQEDSYPFNYPMFPFDNSNIQEYDIDNELSLHETNLKQETENSHIQKNDANSNIINNLNNLDNIDILKKKKKPIFRIEKDKNSKDDEINKVDCEMNKKLPLLNSDKIFDGINDITKEKTNTEMEIGKKRKRPEKTNKQKKRERKDNCFTKIGTNFFNKFVLSAVMGKLIKTYAPNQNLKKFPRKFIRKATLKKNKDLLDENLEYFLTHKELYEKGNKDKKNEIDEQKEYFEPNLAVLEKLKTNANKITSDNSLLENTLNKKYRDLYQEYLKSEEYNKKIMGYEDEENKEKFEDYSRNFIQFFEKK